MLAAVKNSHALAVEKAETVKTSVTPVALTVGRIEKMLLARSRNQLVKFRTTCSDCVPNL
jgi:hypothetical protein